MDELITIEEVGVWLRVTKQTVKKLCREGKIPCVKIGRSWRFDKEELTKWVTNQK